MKEFSGGIRRAAIALALFVIGAGRADADVTVDFAGTLTLAGGPKTSFNGALLNGDFVVSGSLPVDGSTTIIDYDFTITETNNATISGSMSDPDASAGIAFGQTFAGYYNGTVPLDVVTIGVGGTLSLTLDFLSAIDSKDPEIISFSGGGTSTYNYNGYATGYIDPVITVPEPGTLPIVAMAAVMALGYALRRGGVPRKPVD